MPSGSKRIFFENYVFLVDENVYEPAEDSFLFAENLNIEEGAFVLDVGTGCGILAITAAKKAKAVVAVDINPYALRCAKENAALNNVQFCLSFLLGDLFSAFANDVKFDTIIFNAPYLPNSSDECDSILSLSWKGGETGRVIIDRFINESPMYLRSGGHVLLMQSTLANVDETLIAFRNIGMKTIVTAECRVPFFETIVLIEAKRV